MAVATGHLSFLLHIAPSGKRDLQTITSIGEALIAAGAPSARKSTDLKAWLLANRLTNISSGQAIYAIDIATGYKTTTATAPAPKAEEPKKEAPIAPGLGYIYLITNPDGLVYVGKTTRTIEARWNEHRAKYMVKAGSDVVLKAAMKHWLDSSTVIELARVPNDVLSHVEQSFITMYDSRNPAKGRNIE